MGNSYGDKIRVTIFGQSHSEAIGVTIEGIGAGHKIDEDELQSFLERRAPGRNSLSTKRFEADIPEFLCGLKDGITTGTPITAVIKNNDVRSKDYDATRYIPRPGHADYTAHIRYEGFEDYRGGGHFSGRLTAPLCIAGGIFLQLLKEEGINISAKVKEIHGVKEEESFEEEILKAKENGDSVGGIIECTATGIRPGIGEHMFDGIENKISEAVFGIPAVKGIEFGAGFDLSGMYGSESNDPFYIEDGKVVTKTNNCGGILGGITNGMPIVFRVVIKPTPSIYKPQKSVDLRTMEETTLQIEGRHDPCIALRAVPCVEAACAMALYDAML